jgi:hypothetical protein
MHWGGKSLSDVFPNDWNVTVYFIKSFTFSTSANILANPVSAYKPRGRVSEASIDLLNPTVGARDSGLLVSFRFQMMCLIELPTDTTYGGLRVSLAAPGVRLQSNSATFLHLEARPLLAEHIL